MNRLMLGLVAPLAVVAATCAWAQTPAKEVVLADDIPVAHTPPGFWKVFPAPVLAKCTEPLAAGARSAQGR